MPAHRIVLAHRLHVPALDHAEDAENGGRARRRRAHAAHFVDAIAGADGGAFLRLVGAEALDGQLGLVARRIFARTADRSVESLVWNECVRTCRSRSAVYHYLIIYHN